MTPEQEASVSAGGNPFTTGGDLLEMGKGAVPFSDKIFGAPKDDNAKNYRLIGDVASDAAAVVAPGAKAAMKLGERAAPFVSRVLPGATKKATEAISEVAAPTGKFDPMGSEILSKTVGGEYSKLYDARASLLGRAAHVADENDRRRAFRDVYQAPEFQTLRDFEGSALGKKLTATTGKYTEITKADPAKIPHMVFDTPQSVRDFRDLLGGDQTHVEQFARRYAAESMNKILPAKTTEITMKSQAAKASEAVNKWIRDPKQEWLDEVPETKKAVTQFAQGLDETASAQAKLRYGVAGLGGAGLLGEGWHWLKSLSGGL